MSARCCTGPGGLSGPWPLSQRIPISSLDVSGPGNMALESLGGPCTKPLNLELSLWHQLPALCISIKGIDRYPCSGHHVIAAYRLCGQGVCAPPYPPPSMSQAWWEVQEKPPVSLHQGKHPLVHCGFPRSPYQCLQSVHSCSSFPGHLSAGLLK